MSTPPRNRHIGIQARLDRARTHIVALNESMRAFLAANPYHLEGDHDANAGKLFLHVTRMEEVPTEMVLIAADAIHNLRVALDYIAAQLVLAGGGTVSRDTSFPILSGAAKYLKERGDKVMGMDPAAVAAIDALEPYKGGKGHRLWILHELNKTDKHRLLMTVAACCKNVAESAFSEPTNRQFFRHAGCSEDNSSQRQCQPLRPENSIFPLKLGDV